MTTSKPHSCEAVTEEVAIPWLTLLHTALLGMLCAESKNLAIINFTPISCAAERIYHLQCMHMHPICCRLIVCCKWWGLGGVGSDTIVSAVCWVAILGNHMYLTIASCACNRGAAPAWHLQHVEVMNQSTGDRAVFPADKWLDAKLGTTTVVLEAAGTEVGGMKSNKYKVTVQTGDKRGAGTDADISVMLIGAAGKSEEIKLESSADNFERNKVGKASL